MLRQRNDTVGAVSHDVPVAEEVQMATRAFRLRPIMKQGTASSIPDTWTRFSTLDAARDGAKRMYTDDRVLRVMVVTDSVNVFVEWVER